MRVLCMFAIAASFTAAGCGQQPSDGSAPPLKPGIVDVDHEPEVPPVTEPVIEPVAELQSGELIETVTGAIQGHTDDDLRVFKGIPFAQPPVGERRLARPLPVEPWSDVLEADDFGPSCPSTLNFSETSEDCLSLNVWAHNDERVRPVMVFIYGGGFVLGETSTPLYEGDDLAVDADAVIITINYRLGLLGGMALPALAEEDPEGALGNMAVLDQMEALRWVKQNAPAFGGDRENITIFGESAGAMSVCALLGAPGADDLFDKAIMQSGSCHVAKTLDSDNLGGDARQVSERFAVQLGCEHGPGQLACLRALDSDAFVDAMDAGELLGNLFEAELAVGPTVDGVVIPELPYDRLVSGGAPARPLLAGSNGNEGALFTATQIILTRDDVRDTIAPLIGGEQFAQAVVDLYPRLEFPFAKDVFDAFVGEFMFNCNSYHTVAGLADVAGGAGYYYHLEVAPPLLMTARGPLHAAELPYVFGDFLGTGIVPTLVDLQLSGEMQRAFGDFARTGAPSWEGGWPITTEDAPGHMAIDLVPRF